MQLQCHSKNCISTIFTLPPIMNQILIIYIYDINNSLYTFFINYIHSKLFTSRITNLIQY